ncbi:MAG: hypothetical protein K9M15_02730 [Candidatus Marinimicrobia bacterium]|nr:hypothetical protein [Candidatus Neomarinimicrobiota bacterium]
MKNNSKEVLNKIHEFIFQVIHNTEEKKKELIQKDNIARSNGISFTERKKTIDLISYLDSFLSEHRQLLNKKPTSKYLTLEDVDLYEKNFNSFIRLNLKRIYD